MAAYAHHARRLGKTDEKVSAFIEEALFTTVTNVNFDLGSLLGLVLECGMQNLRVMEMLDEGHVKRYGAPLPHTVYEGNQGRASGILVTGHDMVDLEDLLEQTQGHGRQCLHPRRDAAGPHVSRAAQVQANLAGHLRRRVAEAEA